MKNGPLSWLSKRATQTANLATVTCLHSLWPQTGQFSKYEAKQLGDWPLPKNNKIRDSSRGPLAINLSMELSSSHRMEKLCLLWFSTEAELFQLSQTMRNTGPTGT